jgi:hypothetical protein
MATKRTQHYGNREAISNISPSKRMFYSIAEGGILKCSMGILFRQICLLIQEEFSLRSCPPSASSLSGFFIEARGEITISISLDYGQ